MSPTRVPLLDLWAQNGPLEQKIMQAIKEVISSGQFILGRWVEKFEAEVAAYLETPHAIGVSSGTDALLVSLMALDAGPGDAVVTTTFSFFATAGAIARTGARPYFADIEPDTYNISIASAEKAIQKAQNDGFLVKAIIPVHLFGQCADLQLLRELAQQYGLAVIEDAAQAIGARCPYNGKAVPAGTMGAAGCFSFFPSKNLGCFGDGGLVVTADASLAEKIRCLRNHGARPKYYHSAIGGNFRLDALQAAVLSVKLPYLEKWHRQRQENARYYRQLFRQAGLTESGAVSLPAEKYPGVPNGHIYNQFVLRVKDRENLRNWLTERNIGTEIYYPLPFHLQQCFTRLGYRPGDFPVAEKATAEVLAIPIYPELTREQQEYVVGAIADFYLA